MSNNKNPNDVAVELIDQQLTRMEDVIDQLLHNLRLNELDTPQKLNTAVRFIGQYRNMLALRQIYETATLNVPRIPSEAEIIGFMRVMKERPKKEIATSITEVEMNIEE